jgi:hypothetical protein
LKEGSRQGWSTKIRYRNSTLTYGSGTISSRTTAKSRETALSSCGNPSQDWESQYPMRRILGTLSCTC